MATAPITPSQFPPAAAALIAARMLNKHSPREIADAVEILMDLLDLMGGDPDAEPDGTEEDSDGDERGDQAWPEWHTLPAAGRRAGHASLGAVNGWGPAHEDDEEDDPSGVSDEDGVNTERWALAGYGPGCPIADPDFGIEDQGEGTAGLDC